MRTVFIFNFYMRIFFKFIHTALLLANLCYDCMTLIKEFIEQTICLCSFPLTNTSCAEILLCIFNTSVEIHQSWKSLSRITNTSVMDMVNMSVTGTVIVQRFQISLTMRGYSALWPLTFL